MTTLQDTVTVMMEGVAAGSAPEPVTLPRRIGTVKLGEQIGKGGSGTVFSAFDDALNRRVAVKILSNLRGAARDLERGRFVDGVRAAARVKHENLVTIHAVDVVADMPIIVMEFIDGRSLRSLFNTQGKFDLATTLLLARDTCRAVDALHTEQIVHRDLKPANILIDRSGSARVCDFGLATELSTNQLAMIGATISGSPFYMPPEVFEGVISPQADVYAIGVMLFEMLTGQVPFGGETIEAVRDQHVRSAAPLEQLASLALPEELTEILERSLHKQRILRYKTAGHLLRALEQVQTRSRDDFVRARMADAVNAAKGEPSGKAEDHTPTPPPATTYDLLSQRAAAKRRHAGDTPS